MRWRTAWPAALTLLAAGGLAAGASATDDPGPREDLPPPARRAIEAGIEFLIDTQNADGSWLSDGSTGRYAVAMTALSGLALMAEGNTTYSGPHARAVQRAVEFLLQSADPETGLIGGREPGRPMFGHGFAMLFLAQAYGSESRPALRRRLGMVLSGAVQLTARSQNENGGWYYTPNATRDEGAVTITQMQGLRACAEAGIAVPRSVVQKAVEYVRRSANEDGGISYRAGEPGASRPGITAAAVATLYMGGVYRGPLVEPALAYARRNVPLAASTPRGGRHFFYSHLYLSQVMYFRGGNAWEQYFPQIRDWLLKVQQTDGSWQGEFIGRTYGTAVALLVLQLPHNNMPIIQR